MRGDLFISAKIRLSEVELSCSILAIYGIETYRLAVPAPAGVEITSKRPGDIFFLSHVRSVQRNTALLFHAVQDQ